MLQAKNVIKTYNPKRNPFTAIDDVSLTFEEGESVAILGKSGSGKSTLMHMLAGLDTPTSGAILLNGKAFSDTSQKERNNIRNEEVGFVFQSFFMIPDETVFENVALPLRIMKLNDKEIKERVIEMLQLVELEDKKKNLTVNLSGGQKQRVCIARALVTQPSIIFADEPTGNLDSETSAVIEDLLFDMHEKTNATLVVVTHDEDLAEKCERNIFLKDGKIENET